MGKYILDKNIALRSYIGLGDVIVRKNSRVPMSIPKSFMELLKKCDGREIDDDNELIKILLSINIVKKCGGETLDEWQKYIVCDNRCVPVIYLQITGRCNYNCLHCFNAKDNNRDNNELSFDEIKKIIDEAYLAGVNGFRITGGEPLVHKNIREIIEYIYSKGMTVFEFNTNGYFLDKDFLSIFDKYEYKPQLRISFDGLGFHDIMRGFVGAEKSTLDAIALARNMDFDVLINMNLNKKNVDRMIETLKLFDDMNVNNVRLIRTTEAPRAKDNVYELMFDYNAYYDTIINIISEYIKFAKNTELIVWQCLNIYPKTKKYDIYISHDEKKYCENRVICSSMRKMISIGVNGNVYPCLMMSGYFEKYNIKTDNVFKNTLSEILKDGEYLKCATREISDKIIKNEKCKNCKYLKKCCGGCPALSILTSGSMDGEDKSKCIFFNGGYEEKIEKILNENSYKII